jgi:S1-C subfamily serine protease
MKRKLRISGMTWLLIAIALLFSLGGVMTALRGTRETVRTDVTAAVALSYFVAHDFVNADGGVTFADVAPPGSPADKAGLVGGDVITSFDGQVVKNTDDMIALLKQTPPGKTVEVIYIRDGETKKAHLTTASREEFDLLAEGFENRPEGQGQLGFDDREAKRVPVSGTKIHGVQLVRLSLSGPAVLAGIQKGDIIIEFDGVPIRTVGELVTRVRRAKPYNIVKVVVIRGTEQIEIPVKMGKQG